MNIENNTPNEKIRVIVKKAQRAKDIWNLGPFRRTESAQKIVDELKKGW